MNVDLFNSYALKLSRTKNITLAAQELGISQPALSMGITQLEKKLDVRLFDRKTTPISMTDAGKVYLDYVKKQKLHERELYKKLEALKSSVPQCIRIGAPNIYITSLITPFVSRFLASGEQVRLVIESGTVLELAEMCENAEMDIFISTGEMPKDRFVAVPLKKESYYLCVPDKLLASSDSKASEDYDIPKLLADIPLIFLKQGQPLQKALSTALDSLGITVTPVVTVDQVSTALNLVEKGVGACLATDEALSISRNISDTTLFDFSEQLPPRTIYAVYSKKIYIPPICTKIIDILKEECDI
jgi:DNA-binding transcriptional LysR family regulator